MTTGFSNALRVEELKKRLLFTAGMLAVYRVGVAIPTPGIDPQADGVQPARGHEALRIGAAGMGRRENERHGLAEGAENPERLGVQRGEAEVFAPAAVRLSLALVRHAIRTFVPQVELNARSQASGDWPRPPRNPY